MRLRNGGPDYVGYILNITTSPRTDYTVVRSESFTGLMTLVVGEGGFCMGPSGLRVIDFDTVWTNLGSDLTVRRGCPPQMQVVQVVVLIVV